MGDAGAGVMANNLKLGCDCLGHIQYLSAHFTDDKGVPTPFENVVCVHEQDAGIGWKHTNYRTGRAAVVRNRELVLQSIITVSNYEYILAFMFNQAGEVIYEAAPRASSAPSRSITNSTRWAYPLEPSSTPVYWRRIINTSSVCVSTPCWRDMTTV